MGRFVYRPPSTVPWIRRTRYFPGVAPVIPVEPPEIGWPVFRHLSSDELVNLSLGCFDGPVYSKISAGPRVSVARISSPIPEPRKLSDKEKLGVSATLEQPNV